MASWLRAFSILLAVISIFNLLRNAINLDFSQYLAFVKENLVLFFAPFTWIGAKLKLESAKTNNIAYIFYGVIFAIGALRREIGRIAPLAMVGMLAYVITRSSSSIADVKADDELLRIFGTDKLLERLKTFPSVLQLIIVTVSLLAGAAFFDYTLATWQINLGPSLSSVVGAIGALLFSVIFLIPLIAWRHTLAVIGTAALLLIINVAVASPN